MTANYLLRFTKWDVKNYICWSISYTLQYKSSAHYKTPGKIGMKFKNTEKYHRHVWIDPIQLWNTTNPPTTVLSRQESLEKPKQIQILATPDLKS